MSEELTRKPISDIIIVSGEDQECGLGYRELFTREWLGLDQGCMIRGEEILSQFDYDYLPSSKHSSIPDCVETDPHPSIIQSPFADFKICGKEMDSIFDQSIRPDS